MNYETVHCDLKSNTKRFTEFTNFNLFKNYSNLPDFFQWC